MPDLDAAPGALSPGGQRPAGVTAAPDDHRRRIVQLADRELDLYGNQLARCLQALGTSAPIRADVQHELGTVRTEQASRASASEPGRSPDVSGLTPGELERTRRELQPAWPWPSPAHPRAGRSWRTSAPSKPSLPGAPAGRPDPYQAPRVPDPRRQALGLR
jgi:hypothetical protein